MRTRRGVFGRIVLAVLAIATLAFSETGYAQSGGVSWNSWTFNFAVGSTDGLQLSQIYYQGHKLIDRISMPVIRVFYQNNACGPFADLLGGTLSPVPWANNATVAQRQFTLDGRLWYEIGIRDQIGNYDLYQVYYFSSDGLIDAHLFSKGLGCVIDHVHYPNWRIDFDVDGESNDVIEHFDGSTFRINSTEFNANAASAINHRWRVRDLITGLYVDVLPGFSDFTIPNSTTVPATDYSHNTVFGRVFKDLNSEYYWTYGPNTQVPFNEGENIYNADVVLWYEGYMPHLASDGSQLWHSIGIRLVPSLSGSTSDTTPPSAPSSLTAAATSSTRVNLSWHASTDNVGVAGYRV